MLELRPTHEIKPTPQTNKLLRGEKITHEEQQRSLYIVRAAQKRCRVSEEPLEFTFGKSFLLAADCAMQSLQNVVSSSVWPGR